MDFQTFHEFIILFCLFYLFFYFCFCFLRMCKNKKKKTARKSNLRGFKSNLFRNSAWLPKPTKFSCTNRKSKTTGNAREKNKRSENIKISCIKRWTTNDRVSVRNKPSKCCVQWWWTNWTKGWLVSYISNIRPVGKSW